jgi:gliding motility-associated lipoprotein GldH
VASLKINNGIFKALILVASLCGCEPAPYYEKYLTVPQASWHKDSTATFEVEIEEINTPYAVVFNLRGNDNYPYQNLYLFREISSQEGVEYTDTAQITMADTYGRWLGEGIGELKTYRRPYRAQPLRFNQTGTYTFKFTQAMRDTLLNGVEAVGLTLYKEENGAEKKS